MFLARRKPNHPQATLRRRYDFHLGEAIRASLAGSHDKAETHSATALSISRELYRKTGAYRPDLAAALACHAISNAAYGRIGETVTLLAESAGHYAALAEADPAAYEVPRIDVLTRVALASDAAGNTEGAIDLLREVIRMYGEAPAAAEARRDLGRARARFHLGRFLLKTGAQDEALTQLDDGLAEAEQAWGRLRTPPGIGDTAGSGDGGAGPGEPSGFREADEPGDGTWLAAAPRFVQLAAPDWATAAARAMIMHATAGRWDRAAYAARAAVRVSAGLALLGGDAWRESHLAIRAQADVVWARVGSPDGIHA
jgi:tetratricopeptide (TPR) repeat protein